MKVPSELGFGETFVRSISRANYRHEEMAKIAGVHFHLDAWHLLCVQFLGFLALLQAATFIILGVIPAIFRLYF